MSAGFHQNRGAKRQCILRKLEVGTWKLAPRVAKAVSNCFACCEWAGKSQHNATFTTWLPGFPETWCFPETRGRTPTKRPIFCMVSRATPPANIGTRRGTRGLQDCNKHVLGVECTLSALSYGQQWMTIRMGHHVPHCRRVLPKRGAECPGEGATPRPSETPRFGEIKGK